MRGPWRLPRESPPLYSTARSRPSLPFSAISPVLPTVLPSAASSPFSLRASRSPRWWLWAWCFSGAVACLLEEAPAQDSAPAPAGVPAASPPVTVVWTGLPLEAVLERLASSAGVAVVRDRRVDPGTRITLTAEGEPLAAILKRVAETAGAEVADLGSYLRLAPQGQTDSLYHAQRIRTTALSRLPPQLRALAHHKEAWDWPAGARPRDLLARAASQGGLSLTGVETIPHDHLPALTLPPLPLADRLDLLLAHYDFRLDWSAPASVAGRPELKIVPLAHPSESLPSGGPRRPSGSGTSSAASRARNRAKQPANKGALNAPAETFSLRVEAPLEEVLTTLAQRFGLELQLQRQELQALGIAPAEIVRCRVENVSREALLQAVLAPLGLEGELTATVLRVPASPHPQPSP